MRTLATALKNILDRLNSDSPQSPKGVQTYCPAPIRLRARQIPTDDVPIGVDAYGSPVCIPRDKHVLIVGDPRTLVTTAVRTIALHHARFPATRVHVYEAEPIGDLTVLRALAHCYISTAGNGGTTARVTIADLTELAAEIDRRHKVLNTLNDDNLRDALGLPYIPSITALHWHLGTTKLASKLIAAGIDLDLSGFERRVVVIGDAIRWVLSEDDGSDFGRALTQIALRGEAVGISLVIGVKSSYLPYLPETLINAIGTRIAMRLRDPNHTDLVLGRSAREMGIDTNESLPGRPNPTHGYGMCWVRGAVGRSLHQQAQIYATSPDRFKVETMRQARVRRLDNRLTGDAAARYAK